MSFCAGGLQVCSVNMQAHVMYIVGLNEDHALNAHIRSFFHLHPFPNLLHALRLSSYPCIIMQQPTFLLPDAASRQRHAPACPAPASAARLPASGTRH